MAHQHWTWQWIITGTGAGLSVYFEMVWWYSGYVSGSGAGHIRIFLVYLQLQYQCLHVRSSIRAEQNQMWVSSLSPYPRELAVTSTSECEIVLAMNPVKDRCRKGHSLKYLDPYGKWSMHTYGEQYVIFQSISRDTYHAHGAPPSRIVKTLSSLG